MTANRVTGRLVAALGFVLAFNGPALADPITSVAAPSCAARVALSAIIAPLERTASRIQAGKPLTIVAMGPLQPLE